MCLARCSGTNAQQAVEKLFKVLITAHGEEHEFVHDLDRLATQLTVLGETVPPMSLTLKALTDYGIQARYDDGPALSPVVRDALRKEVEALRELVAQRLLTLATAGVLIRKP